MYYAQKYPQMNIFNGIMEEVIMSVLLEVLKNYELFSSVNTIERIGDGNINITYKIICEDGEKYILQKINKDVFRNVEGLMSNIIAVTSKLSDVKMQKSLDKMQVLNIKFTRDCKAFIQYDEDFYRLYEFMPNAITYSCLSNEDAIKKAGEAFGLFVLLVNIGPSLNLVETISGFHNTKQYFEKMILSYQKAQRTFLAIL